MKLSETLEGIGKPVAYYPNLRVITKSTSATVFLCQFIYWIGKETLKDNWIYKTAEEITKETGLSYDEQKTARKNLVDVGLLEEKYQRIEHRMLFKVNKDKLDELWEGIVATPSSGNPQRQDGEHGDTAFGNMATPHSLIGTTENTAETTTENTNNRFPKTKTKSEKKLRDELITRFKAKTQLDFPEDVPASTIQKFWWSPSTDMIELAGGIDQAWEILRELIDKFDSKGLVYADLHSFKGTIAQHKRGAGLPKGFRPSTPDDEYFDAVRR